MAKPLTSDTNQQNAGKRKKRAKQEAKAMLKVEQAKKDVQRAEQRVAKAQTRLEESRTRLHELEQNLNQTRAPQQPEAQIPQELQIQPLQTQNVQNNGKKQMPTASSAPVADTDAIAAFHAASISPSEGRDDLATDQITAQTKGEEQSAQQVVNAEASSTFEPAEGRDDIPANDEDQPLTQAESDTTTEPIGEWGDTSKDANLFDDTDLSQGNLSPEDEVVYHLTDDATATHPTDEDTASRSTRSHDEHATDDTASSTTPATSEGS
jgi:hypothetical protein